MKVDSYVTPEPAQVEAEADWYLRAMEHLVTVVQELSLARSVDRITEIVRTAARKLVNADGASFVLRDNNFCYYADEDAIAPLWKGRRFPLETCVSGWVMLNRKVAVIENIYEDPRVPVEAYRPTFVKSMAMVPIRTLQPVGAIGTYWADFRRPRPEELRLLQALADSTAVAMDSVQLYASLEQKVAERTERLQALNEELDSFSHSVSHDLRAPLRHIGGFVDILVRTETERISPTGQRYLKIVSDSTANMNQLIDDILSFSRMGRGELQCQPLDMNELVEQAWQELEPERKDRNITWSVGTLPMTKGDRAMLKQVWLNLLSNAIKYTRPRNSAEIHVSAQVSPQARDGEVEYCVKDNGVGFDMKYVDRLFGVFQRLHHKTEFEGTGIGLANVRRIIQRHGGKIWATSEMEKGAEFRFTLPVGGGKR